MTLLLINCILQISLFSVPMTMCLSTHNNDCGRTQNMRCFIRAVVMSSGFQVKPSSSVFLASGMRCLACGCRILPSILVVWKFHVRSSTNDFNMLTRLNSHQPQKPSRTTHAVHSLQVSPRLAACHSLQHSSLPQSTDPTTQATLCP